MKRLPWISIPSGIATKRFLFGKENTPFSFVCWFERTRGGVGSSLAKQPCFAVRSPRSERNVSFLLPEKRLLLSISLTSQCSLTSCTTLLHFTQRSLVFSRFRRLSQTFGEKADTHYPAIHLCHCRRSPYICSRSPTLLKKPRPHTDQIGFLHPAVTLIWPHQQ